MIHRTKHSILNENGTAPQLDGTTLRLWGQVCSHLQVLFEVMGSQDEGVYLAVGFTDFLDCPTEMHQVKLRAATQAETDALRDYINSERTEYFREGGHIVIECEEGTFAFWSNTSALVREPGLGEKFAAFVSGPLWRNGPPFEEL